MNDESNAGQSFLSRWSRRKQQARESEETGRNVDADTPPPAAEAAPLSGAADTLPATQDEAASQAPAPEADSAGGSSGAPRLPDLDDVRSVMPDGDFSPFMARGVPADVRNAAMKKLFSDPHYNVMDGLDIYIDDYSQMETMPANMLGRLVSSRMLNLVRDPEGGADARPPDDEVAADPQLPRDAPMVESAASDVAASTAPEDATPVDAAPTLPTPSQSVDSHADTDLQLQPHDAARGGSSGGGTR